MSPSRGSQKNRPPSPKYDRAIAKGIWVLFGLLVGLAVGIFTGHGYVWLGVGLLLGIVMALWRVRPEQQIEED